MDTLELHEILGHIEVEHYEYHLGNMGDGWYIQIRYTEPDIHSGEMEDQHGRKWYISQYATRSEVVQTAFKALVTSLEHQAREHFLYRGERVFGPHFDVDALHTLCQTTKESVRS